MAIYQATVQQKAADHGGNTNYDVTVTFTTPDAGNTPDEEAVAEHNYQLLVRAALGMGGVVTAADPPTHHE